MNAMNRAAPRRRAIFAGVALVFFVPAVALWLPKLLG